MLTPKQNPWIYLMLLGVLLATGPRHDVLAQTGRQSAKRIYVGMTIDDVLGGATGTRAVFVLPGLGAQKLDDALKRNTNASLPRGPQGGVEVTFVAVITQNGKVLREWASKPVRIDGTSLRRVDNQLEVASPWEAFDNPIVGFQEPLVGVHEPFLAFGKPIQADAVTYDGRLRTTANAVAAIWTRHGAALSSHEYALVLMVKSPRDAASQPLSVRPAVVPFSAREGASR